MHIMHLLYMYMQAYSGRMTSTYDRDMDWVIMDD